MPEHDVFCVERPAETLRLRQHDPLKWRIVIRGLDRLPSPPALCAAFGTLEEARAGLARAEETRLAGQQFLGRVEAALRRLTRAVREARKLAAEAEIAAARGAPPPEASTRLLHLLSHLNTTPKE